MTADQFLSLVLVLATVAAVFALGWQSSAAHRDRQAARRQLEADKRTAAYRGLLSEQRAPMPTYRGWVYDTAWRPHVGADTAPMSMVAAMDMADAAYQLGRDRAGADQTHAEVAAMWAEVEADPGKWQT